MTKTHQNHHQSMEKIAYQPQIDCVPDVLLVALADQNQVPDALLNMSN